MARTREIERKFLVTSDAWRDGVTGVTIRQGYLSTEPARTVRVRVVGDGDGARGVLTIKGKTTGVGRSEYEYAIPGGEAARLIDELCLRPLIEKTRHRVPHGGLVWEVDEFHGDNAGLVVAEVELESEEQVFERPPWLGDEVSADPRYYNAALVRRPFREW